MPLIELVPDRLWHAQQTLHFGPVALATRMTMVRLADGGLWIHSPVDMTAELRHALSQLGPVRFVVAPNRSHHLFFSACLAAFPEAQGWIAPGLRAKRPDLSTCRELGADQPWADELVPHFIAGLPLINETAWFHRATGTLILMDLLFCIGPHPAWLARTAARLLGVYGRLAMSATMKFAVRDRKALAASVAPLLELPVRRIVVAHDQVIEDSAPERLRNAFAWL